MAKKNYNFLKYIDEKVRVVPKSFEKKSFKERTKIFFPFKLINWIIGFLVGLLLLFLSYKNKDVEMLIFSIVIITLTIVSIVLYYDLTHK